MALRINGGIVVSIDRIYTRGGDKGETSLVGGSRVPKYSLRICAIGDVDEANAVIGAARLHCDGELDSVLGQIQNDLFDLGADFATPHESNAKAEGALRIAVSQVERLEKTIDRFNAGLAPLTSFVLPGGTAAAAYLHLARTAVRRAERMASQLASRETVAAPALQYLNRLSDLMFVLARHANDRGAKDALWKPGAGR